MEIQIEVLSANKFVQFNPMQQKALDAGIFGESVVVSAPTASGKTIIAELCALNSILDNKKKVIYTCPLRALAAEHYSDFKKKYSKQFGIRMAISTGDFDSSSSYLQNYDLIFTTYEKLQSLLRHKAAWINSVGLIIIDEIHELDSDRGPVIEVSITQLRQINPAIQFLGLSATIPNAKEISGWLSAKLVESDYRPVKLVEGVLFDGVLDFGAKQNEIERKKDSLTTIVFDTLKKQKQALVFANTRKRSEGMAKNLSALTEKSLSAAEKGALEKASQKILHALESPTEQCEALSRAVKNGCAFHNAGLMQKQREIVEGLFRSGLLKIVCSTPTLAAGINMPAYRVVIPSLYRYTAFGNQRIPVREYKQMCLPFDSKIMTKEYGEIEIGKVVEKKLPCNVLSWSEKKR
ncbi:MAG: DEAD/DEAH box helicase, partial [archaeon]